MKDNDNLSTTARTFLKLLKANSPELVEFVEVVSPSKDTPWIEEVGSIIMKIPSPTGSKPEYIYLETRKKHIVIVLGSLVDFHVDWSKDDDLQESVRKAIRFLKDVMDEKKVVLERKVGISFLKWNVVKCIDIETITDQKGTFTVYSWRGTYNASGTK